MNEDHINQIFAHYIEKFEYINNGIHDESYKWRIAKKSRILMDEALSMQGAEFAEALYKVKVCTENMIDSYTQPFYGMVEFARHEPETVIYHKSLGKCVIRSCDDNCRIEVVQENGGLKKLGGSEHF